jgi:hypothetical protein
MPSFFQKRPAPPVSVKRHSLFLHCHRRNVQIKSKPEISARIASSNSLQNFASPEAKFCTHKEIERRSLRMMVGGPNLDVLQFRFRLAARSLYFGRD